MARVICVANQKGGVGKTTTVLTLAAAFAERGRRVLMIDLDPQASLTFAAGLDPDEIDISGAEVLVKGLPIADAVVSTEDGPDLLPATIDLVAAEARLMVMPGRERRLADALADLDAASAEDAGYHDILIDCPPALGVLTLNALFAADDVIIPFVPETLAYRGIGQLLDTIADDVRPSHPRLRVLGVLPTLLDRRSRLARAVLADVAGRYGLMVLPGVPRSVRYAEAPATGRSVLAGGRTASNAAQAYRDLADVVLAPPP